MKKHFQLLAALFCLWLSACSEELGKSDENKVQAAGVETLTDGDILVDLIGENEPNSYRFQLSWKKNLGTLRITDESGTVDSTGSKVIRGRKPAGFSYELEVEQVLTGAKVKIVREIPKDFVFEESKILDKHLEIRAGRVFFRPEVVLTTLSADLFIEAGEIIFERTTIQTFSPGQTAQPRNSGRSGGKIILKANLVRGDLKVSMIGENGGRGSPGEPTQIGGCPGTDGRDGGSSGSFVLDADDSQKFSLQKEMRGGAAGPKGVTGGGYNEPDIIRVPCSLPSLPNYDGRSGSKGLMCIRTSKAEGYACE